MILAGKTALVTGAGRGIGRGVALCLARAGADVAVADIDAASAATVAAGIAAAGRKSLSLQVDVADEASVAAMVAGTTDGLGGLDIAVNNAGVLSTGNLPDLTVAEWDRVFAVNVRGTFLCCRAELGAMAAAGRGAVVNMASVAGKVGFPGVSSYCASKFAVVGFTGAIAREYAGTGITVNAVCPGVVDTAMWNSDEGLSERFRQPGETREEAWKRSVEGLFPQGVPQTVEDIGQAVIFLATAPHVTGQSLNVDGGYTSH